MSRQSDERGGAIHRDLLPQIGVDDRIQVGDPVERRQRLLEPLSQHQEGGVSDAELIGER